LYKWINAVKPDKSEAQANELLLAKQEVLKLRAELRRAQEERDILKKAARYFAQDPE
jgi:transposase